MFSPTATDRPALEHALERAVARFDDGSATSAQMRYHLALGEAVPHGRRLRPLLVLAVCAAEGGNRGDALDAACAVELVHEYALVHDDIADGDRIRRGRDAAWARFGLAHGINAGDALCAVAYLALLDGEPARPAARTAAMTRVLLAAQIATCAGQANEIAYRAGGGAAAAAPRALVAAKAGALYAAAAEIGALSAGASSERARAYGRMGECFGVALQRTDDAAPAEAAAQEIAAAGSLAAAHDLDRDGSVRAFFAAGLQRG